VVGIGDCDAEYRGAGRSYEVADEAATSTLLIDDVTPWRRYAVIVSALYDTGHAAHTADHINSTHIGQPADPISLKPRFHLTTAEFSGRVAHV